MMKNITQNIGSHAILNSINSIIIEFKKKKIKETLRICRTKFSHLVLYSALLFFTPNATLSPLPPLKSIWGKLH